MDAPINSNVQIPIKISGSQPIFVSNQVIGSGVDNAVVSYILPSSSICTNTKPTVVQEGSSLNMPPTIVSTIAPIAMNHDGIINTTTLIGNEPNVINQNEDDSSKCSPNVKLIPASPRHLVFSPIKSAVTMAPTVIQKSLNTINNQILLKNSQEKTSPCTSITDSIKTSFTTPAIVANSNQQQQLIILSPVKQNQNNKSSFISSFKLVPNSKTPVVASSSTSPKRLIAPAPTTKSSLSSVSQTGRPVHTTSNVNLPYISLVPLPNNNQLNAAPKLVVPLKTSTTTIKATPNQSTSIKSNVVQVGQKVIVNPNPIKISTSIPTSVSTIVSQSNSSKKNQPTSIWMLPKQMQIKVNENSPNSSAKPPSTKYVPIAPNPSQANSNVQDVPKIKLLHASPKNTSENLEESRRKLCNCTRSQCLKLYCDCFANGEFCNGCNCVSCYNNLEHEEIRQKAIRMCLDRNPNAFHPKIGQSHQGDVERRHTKGCCCKRSGCLKNYCECYEAKILCSERCKCVSCKNFEESTERKTLMHLVDDAEVRSAQQSVTSKMHIWGPDFKPKLPVKVRGDCHPFNVMTDEILEATANCLLAQAEEGEFENLSDENMEGLLLDQFGECLSQILNVANGYSEDIDGNSEDDDTLNDDMD